MNTQAPKIPLSVFREMAKSLPPAELAKLPPENLPTSIPVEFLESLDIEKSQAIDELILAQQMSLLNKRKLLRNELGAEVAKALGLAERNNQETSAGKLRKVLVSFLNRLKSTNRKLNLNRAIELLELLESHRDLTGSLLEDHHEITRGRKLLRQKQSEQTAFSETLKEAESRLEAQSNDLCELLGRYHAERCRLCLSIMLGYQQFQQRHNNFRTEIGKRLDTLTGGAKSADERMKSEDGRQLHNEVRTLFGQMRDHDMSIDESDFIYWMDIVVDFSLFRRTNARYEALADKCAHVLGALMKLYFAKLEDERMTLETNRYAPVPVELGDSFTRNNESFLNSYLERKRSTLHQQPCIPTSDRVYALKRLQRVLSKPESGVEL